MGKPHSRSLRRGRASVEGQIYLITAATHLRKPLFTELATGRIVVNALRYQQDQGNAETLAFVVMPDHLHWLMVLSGEKELSEVMNLMKGYSGHRLRGYLACSDTGVGSSSNNRHPVWQDGFHDHALRRDEDVANVARYVVMNPVRAGLVKTVWQYPLWDAVWIE